MSLESTSKFQVKGIIYQSNAFAVAMGIWNNEPGLVLACRWYGEGLGYPQTFGKPQWMLLPPGIEVEVDNLLNSPHSAITLRFPPIMKTE